MNSTAKPLKEIIETVVETNKGKLGALLPILHSVQEELGHIPPESVPLLSNALNLSRAEIQGVIGFYHDFRSEPGGKHVVHICRAEACQAMGSRDLERHAVARLGISYGETTADGKFTLQPVYCLGNCACSPSVRIDDDLYARVNPDRFDELINHLEELD